MQLVVEGKVTWSVHSLALQDFPEVFHEQVERDPSVVALQSAKLAKGKLVQAVMVKQLIPLKEQVLRYAVQLAEVYHQCMLLSYMLPLL